MNGPLFCIYVKLFLPSLFNSVAFWCRRSMSRIVLDNELAEKNVFKQWGVFIDGKFQVYPFSPPKIYKPTKQTFWCTRNLHGIVCNSGRLDYSQLPNVLPSDLKAESFAKRTEKCELLAVQWVKRWKTWKILAIPKLHISKMKECGFVGITHSDTKPHFSVQSARKNCLVTG